MIVDENMKKLEEALPALFQITPAIPDNLSFIQNYIIDIQNTSIDTINKFGVFLPNDFWGI